jgi:hypothetical protein
MGKRWYRVKRWGMAQLFNTGNDGYRLERDRRATVVFSAAGPDQAVKLSRQIAGIVQGNSQGRLI